MSLSDLSVIELKKLTIDQLIAGILEGQTYSDVNLVKDKDGNNVELVDTELDAWGKVVSTKTVRWTYYKTGEVDEITVTDDKERLFVKHFRDGKQPIATKELIKPEPMEK